MCISILGIFFNHLVASCAPRPAKGGGLGREHRGEKAAVRPERFRASHTIGPDFFLPLGLFNKNQSVMRYCLMPLADDVLCISGTVGFKRNGIGKSERSCCETRSSGSPVFL